MTGWFVVFSVSAFSFVFTLFLRLMSLPDSALRAVFQKMPPPLPILFSCLLLPRVTVFSGIAFLKQSAFMQWFCLWALLDLRLCAAQAKVADYSHYYDSREWSLID
jgi:hypothetical protein